MLQTLLFPADATDKGIITDAGTNTGGLTIDGKLVCVLGSKATHPQGQDALLFHSNGITLDGVPLSLSGGNTALGAVQLQSSTIVIEVVAGNTATGNPLAPAVIGDPIIKVKNVQLTTTYAHDCFIKLAKDTDEYFWCWYFIEIFGAGPGIAAYRKLYKEAREDKLKNPPLILVENDIVRYAGYGLLHNTIYINKKLILKASQPLENETPESALVASSLYDASVWLTRVRLLAALIEEYGEYIYAHLCKLAGKNYSNAGYDAGSTYAFGIMDKIMPENHIPLVKGNIESEIIDIKLSSDWWNLHINEIRQANTGEQAREEDGESRNSDGERIKDFGEGPGDIANNLFTHGGIERVALFKVVEDINLKEINQVYYGNWLRDNSQGIDRMLLNLGKDTNIKFGGNGAAGVITMNKTLTAIMLIKGMKEFMFNRLLDSFKKIYKGAKTLTYPVDLNNNDFTNAKMLVEYTFNYKKAIKDFNEDFGDPFKYLGCYRSEEHLDNPHLMEDARTLTNYVALNPNTDFKDARNCWYLQLNTFWGTKNYIRADDKAASPKTNTDFINTFGRPTSTGYGYILNNLKIACKKGRNQEGYIALGAALHTLQDYYAHSNYCELSLIKLGEDKVFPWANTVGHKDWELDPSKQLNNFPAKVPLNTVKQFVLAYYTECKPEKFSLQKKQPGAKRYVFDFNPYKETTGYFPGNFMDNPNVYEDPAFKINIKDYTKNKYPASWIERRYFENFHSTVNKHYYILQEMNVYSDGTYDVSTYQRLSVYTNQPIPIPPNIFTLIRGVTVMSNTYRAQHLPVVTGKFGSLDTVHSILDIITEYLQPAAFWDNVLDSLLDTFMEAAREETDKKIAEEAKQNSGGAFLTLWKFFENVNPDDVNLSMDYLAEIITTYTEQTNDKDLNKILKSFKANLLEFKKDLVFVIRAIQSKDAQQLRKIIHIIYALTHLRDVLKKAITKLIPIFNKYLIGSIVHAVSNFITWYQTYQNQLATALKKRSEKNGLLLISEQEDMEHSLYTNPTHSQLAKDSKNAPLHILAGNLAIFATERIAEKVYKVWQGKGNVDAVEDAINMLLTHPYDKTNIHIIEIDKIVRGFIKDYPDKVKSASNMSVSKWIVSMAALSIEMMANLVLTARRAHEKLVQIMDMVEEGINKSKDTIKTAIENLEEKLKESKKYYEELRDEYIKMLNRKIINIEIEIKNFLLLNTGYSSSYPGREPNSQYIRDSKAYQLAGDVSSYKLELAALEKLDLDKVYEVLPRWYDRKYRRKFSNNFKESNIWT